MDASAVIMADWTSSQTLIEALRQRNVEIADVGTDNDDSVDYPDFAEKVAGAVSRARRIAEY